MNRQRKGEGRYNVVVIGAGTAGLVSAAGLSALGARVALIERNKMGGDCLNFGCVPSKALISSARTAQTMRRAGEWGLPAVEPEIDFATVMERMRTRRSKIAPHDSQERFESLGVDVFRGEARFKSPHEITVDGAPLRASYFVIATGTRAAVLPIDGLDGVPYFTNETIFDQMQTRPERLFIIGGGPIGCELAQALQRLGVRVTIVQKAARLLQKEDPDISAFAQKILEDEGVEVLTGAETTHVTRRGHELHLTLRQGEDKADRASDALLLAAGRTPNIDGLNLKVAGVKANKKGVEVNDYLQTSQRHIYAAGDVTGRYLFTHMADYQARIVVRNILLPVPLLRQKADYSSVPWCTYLDPEIAHVGLTEREAKKLDIEYELIEQRMSEVDRAVVESAESGFARILLKKGSDKILGATVVAEHAGDLLQPFVLAMRHGLGLSKIGATIHPYPTFVEYARKLADHHNRKRLTPFARKIFARRFGQPVRDLKK